MNITIKEIALQMWLDRKWVGKIVSLTPSITLWKTRKSFKEQCTQYCYYHNYFVFLLNYMIIAAYYLLLLFYEITKLYDYWLVNLCSFVKWTQSSDFSLATWHIQWLFRFLLNIDAQFSLLFIENYNFHIFSNSYIYHNKFIQSYE